MSDWNDGLDEFFAGQADAQRQEFDRAERLRIAGIEFLERVQAAMKESGAALNRHGRHCLVRSSDHRDRYGSVELLVDRIDPRTNAHVREMEYRIGVVELPDGSALATTESGASGVKTEESNFGKRTADQITVEDIRDRVVAVYKATLSDRT